MEIREYGFLVPGQPLGGTRRMETLFVTDVRFYCSSIHFRFNTLVSDGFDNQVFMLKHGDSQLDAVCRGLTAVQSGTNEEETS